MWGGGGVRVLGVYGFFGVLGFLGFGLRGYKGGFGVLGVCRARGGMGFRVFGGPESPQTQDPKPTSGLLGWLPLHQTSCFKKGTQKEGDPNFDDNLHRCNLASLPKP